MTLDEQCQRYHEPADDPLALVQVTARAEELTVFEEESLDFVIANHQFEPEDPIAALLELRSVRRCWHSNASKRFARRSVAASSELA